MIRTLPALALALWAAPLHALDGAEASRLISKALAEAGQPGSAVLSANRGFPPCSEPARVGPKGGSWNTVRLSCEAPGESWVRFVRVEGSARAAVVARKSNEPESDGMALVLTESLAKGTVLNAAHLTLVASTSAIGAGTLSDPARAIGRRLRGNLGAGQPLLARHFEFDYAVTQGMSVTITNEIRGIRIETAEQSLDSGQLGEPVRVANRSSGRILRAIVSGPNKVTLAPNIR